MSEPTTPPGLQAPSPSIDAAKAERVVRLTRAVAVSSLLGLIVLGLVWELWLAPTGNGSLALLVLPLAFPLTGLLRHRLYTHRWVSLLVWPYFALGVVRATTEAAPASILAWVQVLLCLTLFSANTWHVRWRLANRTNTPEGTASSHG
jgi:uncharacterized membrane protein